MGPPRNHAINVTILLLAPMDVDCHACGGEATYVTCNTSQLTIGLQVASRVVSRLDVAACVMTRKGVKNIT
jgi:DNA polymerase II large subunit